MTCEIVSEPLVATVALGWLRRAEVRVAGLTGFEVVV